MSPHGPPPGGSAISAPRLWAALEAYARDGATPAGGVDRPVFSEADRRARERFVADCRALGLRVRVDAAANVVCARPGTDATLPPIMIGSHLDSVPDGGRFDGPLGVLCGLEVMRALVERGVGTRHPVELVSLTGEEATPFGTSTFGSRALAGRLPDVAANLLPDGRSVREALRDAGGDWAAVAALPATVRPPACFLEAHIEQGRRLEDAGKPLAVVSGVCGIVRHRVVFRGQSAHAGTTPMGERRDALRAAARLVLAMPLLAERAAASDASATATVGSLQVVPNSPNVIPGQVTAITDLRSADATVLAALAAAAADEARGAADREGSAVAIATMLDQAPVGFSRQIRAALSTVVADLGGLGEELASLAGHDAVHLGALAPAGMLFVRCAGGLSHCPAESVTPADAALAAEALLRAVLELDATLDRG